MPQEKGLLILDDHSSHTLSLAAVEVPCEHGVIMAAFPQHPSNASSRCHACQGTEHRHGTSGRNEAGQTERTASLVGSKRIQE
jgi:hypothetical protein